jgi:hypothetical protein
LFALRLEQRVESSPLRPTSGKGQLRFLVGVASAARRTIAGLIPDSIAELALARFGKLLFIDSLQLRYF